MKTSKQFDNFIFCAALFAILGYFVAVSFLQVQNVDIVKDNLSTLKIILVGLVAWKWGSSASSQKKDEVIKDALANNQQSPTEGTDKTTS